MIRDETEYEEAAQRLDEAKKRLAEHEAQLKSANLGLDELKRALDPLQLAEEVEDYERRKRGDTGEPSPR